MPPYGFMPQKRRAHYNTLCVYCQVKTLHTLKKTNKKQPRKLSPARPPFNKMQGNHPLCPHSTHYPHFVKHFLAKKNNRASFHSRGHFSNNEGEPPPYALILPTPHTKSSTFLQKKQPRKLSPARLFIQKCKGTTPYALILPITPTLSSIFLQKKGGRACASSCRLATH